MGARTAAPGGRVAALPPNPPARSSLTTAIGLLLLRLGPAAVFIAHGYLKLLGGHYDRTVALFLTVNIPLPEAAAWVIGGLEFFGGVALLVGLLVRPVAALLAVEMAVAIYAVVRPRGFVGGAEFETVLMLACLALVFLGGGRLALDAHLTR